MKRALKSILMILMFSVATLASQLLLKKGITDVAEKGPAGNSAAFLYHTLISPFVIAAIGLQIAGYIVWIFVISRLKLAVAVAFSGSFFYILMAISGWLFFNERLTAVQWAGIFLITAGVVCLNLRTSL